MAKLTEERLEKIRVRMLTTTLRPGENAERDRYELFQYIYAQAAEIKRQAEKIQAFADLVANQIAEAQQLAERIEKLEELLHQSIERESGLEQRILTWYGAWTKTMGDIVPDTLPDKEIWEAGKALANPEGVDPLPQTECDQMVDKIMAEGHRRDARLKEADRMEKRIAELEAAIGFALPMCKGVADSCPTGDRQANVVYAKLRNTLFPTAEAAEKAKEATGEK